MESRLLATLLFGWMIISYFGHLMWKIESWYDMTTELDNITEEQRNYNIFHFSLKPIPRIMTF